MMRNLVLLFLSLLVIMPCQADIYIATHIKTHVKHFDQHQLAAIYLLKQRFWDDEQPIIPLNMPAQTLLRQQFTQAVFHRSPKMLGNYWNKMLFKGINPPLIQSSEQAALLFIKRVPGAICYLSKRPADNEIKILMTLPDP